MLNPEEGFRDRNVGTSAPTGSSSSAEGSAGSPALRWAYSESSEPMGRGVIKTATVSSVNEIEFDFPYRGSQRATLQLRVHPKYGKDVILSVERGQFLCRIDGCSVSVRFDQGKAQTFGALEPADHSSEYLFLSGYDRFLAGTLKSSRVYIEAQFFQQGSRVFEFNVAGLKNAAPATGGFSTSRGGPGAAAEAEARSWKTQANCEADGFVWRDGACHARK